MNIRQGLVKHYHFRCCLHKKFKLPHYSKSIKAFQEFCMLMGRRMNFWNRSIDQIDSNTQCKTCPGIQPLIPLSLDAIFQAHSSSVPGPGTQPPSFLRTQKRLIFFFHIKVAHHSILHLNNHMTSCLQHLFVLPCDYLWIIMSRRNLIIKIFREETKFFTAWYAMHSTLQAFSNSLKLLGKHD